MSKKIILKAENLTLFYKPTEPIIKKATLDVYKGDFIFLTGKSGSGKSTFLKSIYGEVPVILGNLIVNGLSLNSITTSKLNLLRRHIGVIFQDYKLINEWNVLKNVMLPLIIAGYPKDICEKQAKKLLKHVKLESKEHSYPLELSGGEQQRVAMARALAHNPKLIVADEPTGNLDEYSSNVIWELLKNVKNHLNSTIIVVTHKIPSTTSFDYRQFYIDSGIIHEVF